MPSNGFREENRTQCLNHSLQLSAKKVLQPFTTKKRRKADGSDDEEGEEDEDDEDEYLPDLLETDKGIEEEDNEAEIDDASDDGEGDDTDEQDNNGFAEADEGFDEDGDEDNETVPADVQIETQEVRLALTKVSRCSTHASRIILTV
jgi:hypothetical protein